MSRHELYDELYNALDFDALVAEIAAGTPMPPILT
jgi:hypothetical protein